MKEKTKEELQGAGIAAIIILGLGWILWTMFGSGSLGFGGNSTGGANNSVGGTTVGGETVGGLGGSTFDIMPYGGSVSDGSDCCCGSNNGCSINPNTIATVNTMISQANAANNVITQAGNATLQAIADYYNASDPMLQVTVG